MRFTFLQSCALMLANAHYNAHECVQARLASCISYQPQTPEGLESAPRLLSFDMDSAHNQPAMYCTLLLALIQSLGHIASFRLLQAHRDASVGQNNGRWRAASNTLTLQGRLAELFSDLVKALSSLFTISVKARKAERFTVLCYIVRQGWCRITLPSAQSRCESGSLFHGAYFV